MPLPSKYSRNVSEPITDVPFTRLRRVANELPCGSSLQQRRGVLFYPDADLIYPVDSYNVEGPLSAFA